MLPRTQTSISLHCSRTFLKLTPDIAIWLAWFLWLCIAVPKLSPVCKWIFFHTRQFGFEPIQEARVDKTNKACFLPCASTQRCQTSSMFAKRRQCFTSLRCSLEAANLANQDKELWMLQIIVCSSWFGIPLQAASICLCTAGVFFLHQYREYTFKTETNQCLTAFFGLRCWQCLSSRSKPSCTLVECGNVSDLPSRDMQVTSMF